MQSFISHVDKGDDAIMYLKTASHFYSFPDKHVEKSEDTRDGALKTTKSKLKVEKKTKSKKGSDYKKMVDWENYDSKTY